jgi:hypothetical protein
MKVVDPLAQSFYIDNPKGVFITSVDLYFTTKDPVLPVTVQLRPMELGIPKKKVYPFSEVVLDPLQVFTSDDASIGTRVTFPSPVYLEGKKFHAIVILSMSENYNVWVSRLNEIDVSTASLAESRQVLVTKQPTLGGLFKSQNASTWNESPYEDLKFRLLRANFTTTEGNFRFFNPPLSLGNKQIATLVRDPLEFSSRIIRISLGSTVNDSDLSFGNTILQKESNGSGNLVDVAGIATGTMTIVNPGIGYTPSLGYFTYTGVALTSITGDGRNATANISIENGVAVGATIVNGGSGYLIGDVLSVDQLGNQTLGKSLQISVSNLSGINELILDNVQGDFLTGVGKTIQYINNVGITTDLNASTGGNVLIINEGIQVLSDGLNIRVNHKNHGMHAGENIVVINGVQSNVKPAKLISDYSTNSTQSITLDTAIDFTTFENVGVGSTNPGYIRIGNEIISYEGVSANTLTGITRQIDQTLGFSYASGTPVYKYEIDGISLRRINKQHTLQDATVSDPIDFDYYTIKIDTSQAGKTDPLPFGQVDRSVGTSFPKLYVNESRSLGGKRTVTATQNIQYEILKPNIQTTILNGTNITSRVRTISGTSVDGTETSFEDRGFTDIELEKTTYFDSPRLICSQINEQERLVNIPDSKSMTMELSLYTTNNYISPVVDLDRVAAVFTTNRINSPIQNYITDNRVNTINNDPSSFIYATNSIQLEIPATSLKVIVAAYVNTFSDLRLLYSIKNDPNDPTVYYPFPGYSNLTQDGRVLSDSLSDGTSDKKVIKTSTIGYYNNELEYKDYEFTVSNLPSFKYFSIKMVGSGTNQAFPPRMTDFRVIALA